MVTFKLLGRTSKIFTPPYKNDVGFDIGLPWSKIICAKETVQIDLGISISAMKYFAFLLPRSSTSKKELLVHTGTIDPDYKGEIKCCVTNLSKSLILLEQGFKICQLVFLQPVKHDKVEIIDIKSKGKGKSKPKTLLLETKKLRLESGFGSSGK
jgi:dUTPase